MDIIKKSQSEFNSLKFVCVALSLSEMSFLIKKSWDDIHCSGSDAIIQKTQPPVRTSTEIVISWIIVDHIKRYSLHGCKYNKSSTLNLSTKTCSSLLHWWWRHRVQCALIFFHFKGSAVTSSDLMKYIYINVYVRFQLSNALSLSSIARRRSWRALVSCHAAVTFQNGKLLSSFKTLLKRNERGKEGEKITKKKKKFGRWNTSGRKYVK